MSEPTTAAGRTLLSERNWQYLCRLPIPMHGFTSITDAVLAIEAEARAAGEAAIDVWEATQAAFADVGWPPTSEQASRFFASLERRGYHVARLAPERDTTGGAE